METAKYRQFPNVKEEFVCASNIINNMDERIHIRQSKIPCQ